MSFVGHYKIHFILDCVEMNGRFQTEFDPLFVQFMGLVCGVEECSSSAVIGNLQNGLHRIFLLLSNLPGNTSFSSWMLDS